VQRGDTLYSIAVAFGQDYRDLARWNNLEDPTKLAVGQTLRVVPPEGESPGVVVGVVAVNPSAPTETRPLEPTPVPVAPAVAPPAAPTAQASEPAPAPKPTPAPAKPAVAESGLLWQWPAAGKVIEPFAEGRSKGIGIAGAEGDPVLAAGDGEVVYSGSGLRGYGNLVIIKHSDDFISAYAHNRQILVKQGQAVRRGQKIAELGKTDTTVPKLHFEIRHRGKPVDPLRYLPPR
jgi:lipoprotein NlpD